MGANCEICENFTFKDEFDLALETWAKELPDNISVVYYDGGAYMKNVFSRYNNLENVYHLHLACEDDMRGTFKKTWMAYRYIYEEFAPDWIFRTNTSTYINILLLNEFVTNHANPSYVYGSDLYSLSEACCPWPLCIYPRGNGVLLSSKLYKPTIIENGISFAYSGICDDIVIGNLLNTYIINSGCKYTDYIKGIPHAWYKSVDNVFDNHHKLSKFGSSDLPYEQFVTITVKKYREREKEKQHYIELDEYMKEHQNQELYKDKMEYIDNPDIFIGSILGYISFDEWNATDKNELFFIEISNKATDDEQYNIYRDIQGKRI